jgi:hypothetical protein
MIDQKREEEIAQDHWMNTIFGAIEQDKKRLANTGRSNVKGYDVAEFIRHLLKQLEASEAGQEILRTRNIHLSKLSVVELILVHPAFADLRKFVGVADLFWSHTQAEPFLGARGESTCAFMKFVFARTAVFRQEGGGPGDETNLDMATFLKILGDPVKGVDISVTEEEVEKVHKAAFIDECHSNRVMGGPMGHHKTNARYAKTMAPTKSRFIWMDYFSLRQNEADFDADDIVDLVNEIGNTIVALPMDPRTSVKKQQKPEAEKEEVTSVDPYFSRSFCVLEAFAAIKAEQCRVNTADYIRRSGLAIVQFTERGNEGMSLYRRSKNIDLANAVARRMDDKALILRGFKHLNCAS